jgi:hypothetical protein
LAQKNTNCLAQKRAYFFGSDMIEQCFAANKEAIFVSTKETVLCVKKGKFLPDRWVQRIKNKKNLYLMFGPKTMNF